MLNGLFIKFPRGNDKLKITRKSVTEKVIKTIGPQKKIKVKTDYYVYLV